MESVVCFNVVKTAWTSVEVPARLVITTSFGVGVAEVRPKVRKTKLAEKSWETSMVAGSGMYEVEEKVG